MKNIIDYALRVSEKQIDNYLVCYKFHELKGGTFRTIETVVDPIYKTKVIFSSDFSDKCDCKVRNKCNKYLPLIFSNN
jgi:hypothetical protein